MRILVAEDDVKLAQFVRNALLEEGCSVDMAHDGDSAWLLAGTNTYDLLILDIMLPRRTGLNVLRQLRDSGTTTPVLLLTARDSVDDKVAGLDLGADDYVTKPFMLSELLASVRALGRRKDAIEAQALTCDELVLDLKSHNVVYRGNEILLTKKEFVLLTHLLKRKGTVVTHTDIMDKVWDVNLDIFSDVLKVVISRLRRKLEAAGAPQLIRTIRGIGYMMKEPDDGPPAED